MSFLTDSGVVLDRQWCYFGRTLVSFLTDSGVVLNKKCCRFGQEVLSFWTRSVDVLYIQMFRFGQEVHGAVLKSGVAWEMQRSCLFRNMCDLNLVGF